MTTQFKFDPVKHSYTLDGELLPGVTTVLGTLSKPALIQWAANMACDYIKENSSGGGVMDYLVTEATLKEARTAHAKKRDKAADQGTDVHAEIEGIIKTALGSGGKIVDTPVVNNQAKLFIDWAKTNDVTFYESEKKLYSPTHKFAGTVDFTCSMNGKRLVGDIKTTSGIYDLSPFLQVAAYRICLEEMGEPAYDGGVIIRLGKDGSFEEFYRYDAGDDMDTFLALLKVYKSMAKFKNQNK